MFLFLFAFSKKTQPELFKTLDLHLIKKTLKIIAKREKELQKFIALFLKQNKGIT